MAEHCLRRHDGGRPTAFPGDLVPGVYSEVGELPSLLCRQDLALPL